MIMHESLKEVVVSPPAQSNSAACRLRLHDLQALGWQCGKCTSWQFAERQDHLSEHQKGLTVTFPVQLLTMINGLSACAAAVHMPLRPLHAWARKHQGRTLVQVCASGSVLAVTSVGRLPRDAAMQVQS